MAGTVVDPGYPDVSKDEHKELCARGKGHSYSGDAPTVKGAWTEDIRESGGLRKPNNPQLQLTVPEQVDVYLFLRRIHKSEAFKNDGLRFHVYAVSKDDAGKRILSTDQPIIESSYPNGETCRICVPNLSSEYAYVILLSSKTPATPADFEFTADVDRGKPSPSLSTLPLEGTYASFGPLKLSQAWGGLKDSRSPQFFVSVSKSTDAIITVSVPAKSTLQFWVRAVSGPLVGRRLKVWLDRCLVDSSKLVSNATQATLTTHLQDGNYTILVSSKNAEEDGPVSLSVTTLAPCEVKITGAECDDEEAGAADVVAGCGYDDIVESRPADECVYIRDFELKGKTYSETDAQAIVDSITSKAMESGSVFSDASFPAGVPSLNADGCKKKPIKKPDDYHWLRPSGVMDLPVLYGDGVSSGDVIQGHIGDCWLCGALAAVATQPGIINTCFYPSAYNPAGIYAVRLYATSKPGRTGDDNPSAPVWMLLDDAFPCFVDSGRRLAFMRGQDPSEMWAPLLEKAYAKVMGCYAMLKGGPEALVLESLSGGRALGQPTKDMSLDDIYKALSALQGDGSAGGSIATCTSRDGGEDEDVRNSAVTAQGIVTGHGYSVLRCLCTCGEGDGSRLEGHGMMIRVRNPWGSGEWTGPWGDNDAERWTAHPEVKSACNFEGPSDDGAFWMTGEDFKLQFKHVVLCASIPKRDS